MWFLYFWALSWVRQKLQRQKLRQKRWKPRKFWSGLRRVFFNLQYSFNRYHSTLTFLLLSLCSVFERRDRLTKRIFVTGPRPKILLVKLEGTPTRKDSRPWWYLFQQPEIRGAIKSLVQENRNENLKPRVCIVKYVTRSVHKWRPLSKACSPIQHQCRKPVGGKQRPVSKPVRWWKTRVLEPCAGQNTRKARAPDTYLWTDRLP